MKLRNLNYLPEITQLGEDGATRRTGGLTAKSIAFKTTEPLVSLHNEKAHGARRSAVLLGGIICIMI